MVSKESLARWVNPAFCAALALVSIQVGIGILFKAVQSGGEYSFSISASITISEFFKLCLSSIFFYQTCWKRHRKLNQPYHQIPEEQPLASLVEGVEDDSKEDGTTKTRSSKDMSFSSLPFNDSDQREWTNRRFTPMVYIQYCRDEVDIETVYGYGQLALLYATINNTVFVLFKLADPGTIQLIKSGITLVTALVLMITLGTKIARLQWVAIGLQVCGLIVTQYHPGTGTVYPIPTYAVLFFQTLVSAVAGVYNQNLLKSHDSSMHAQNMILYAFGVLTNFIIHQIICFVKPEEPGLFQGFDHIGAILVILSSVLNGLAITAVYKYADAIVKCFATAFSTAILLYVSPLLFNADFSFLVVPGTAVVFTATWLYMDAAPPKVQQAYQLSEVADSRETSQSWIHKIVHAFTSKGKFASLGLLFTTSIAITGIALLNLWDTHAVSHSSGSEAVNGTTTVISPFANTIGFVRFNSWQRTDRLPMLTKYEPFFHTLHNSIPKLIPKDKDGNVFYNSTLDTYESSRTPYLAVAKVMEANLNDTTVGGLFFFHFDAWIHPFEFSSMDFNRIWYPDAEEPLYKCYDNEKEGKKWESFDSNHLFKELGEGLAKVDSVKYKFDPKLLCQGWSDIYYVPRRFFEDFIYLSSVMIGYHEGFIPTILNVIDTTYRSETEASLIQLIGDCWGNCCAKHPKESDIDFRRCGHRLDYREEKITKYVYDRLDRQAALLTNQTEVQESVTSRLLKRSSMVDWTPEQFW